MWPVQVFLFQPLAQQQYDYSLTGSVDSAGTLVLATYGQGAVLDLHDRVMSTFELPTESGPFIFAYAALRVPLV